MPSDTGVTVTMLPDIATDATDRADDRAQNVSASPSGSRNALATSTVTGASSTPMLSAASEPTGSGGRLAATVTANNCDTLKPPGSVAVTRIVAVPAPTAVRITRAPIARTVATYGDDDDTV